MTLRKIQLIVDVPKGVSNALLAGYVGEAIAAWSGGFDYGERETHLLRAIEEIEMKIDGEIYTSEVTK